MSDHTFIVTVKASATPKRDDPKAGLWAIIVIIAIIWAVAKAC